MFTIRNGFISNRYQRVVLNDQTPKWTPVYARVTQYSTLGPLLFLIYINDLFNRISSKCRLFTVDTSIFSVVPNVHASTNNLNSDVVKINKWTHHWEMGFNPDPSKYAQEVIFSPKIKKQNHPVLIFNENQIKKRNHSVLIFNENQIKKPNHPVLISMKTK